MPTIPQIREGEVPAELAGTYADIRHCLRVSFVPLLFRAIAPQPGALKLLWRQLRPNVTTRAFENSADALRARLATTSVNLGTGLIEPVLLSNGLDVDDLDDLRQQIDIFHYVDPKLLLCAVILQRMLDGATVGGLHVDVSMRAKIPEEIPSDMAPLTLLERGRDGIMRDILKEILASTHLPSSTEDLRALGRWPGFIEVAWQELRSVFQHPELENSLDAIRYEAEMRAQRLPYAMELPEKELRAKGGDLKLLRNAVNVMFEALPRLSFFVATLTVAMDGAQDGLESPFPIEVDEDTARRYEEESVLR